MCLAWSVMGIPLAVFSSAGPRCAKRLPIPAAAILHHHLRLPGLLPPSISDGGPVPHLGPECPSSTRSSLSPVCLPLTHGMVNSPSRRIFTKPGSMLPSLTSPFVSFSNELRGALLSPMNVTPSLWLPRHLHITTAIIGTVKSAGLSPHTPLSPFSPFTPIRCV